MAALSVSGLPTDRFCFEGFPPSKHRARLAWLETLVEETRTLIFFESVHRIRASLADIASVFGRDRPAFLGRELTKLHEECIRATLGELEASLEDDEIADKGEFVIVIGGAEKPTSSRHLDTLLVELAAVLPGRQAAALAAKLAGVGKNAAYRRWLDLKQRA